MPPAPPPSQATRLPAVRGRGPLPGLRVPPAIPGLPDPLRRFPVPDDLDAVTTVGREEDPLRAGMTREGVERIWTAVMRLYRTGVHPAIQLTLRREGHVVLDRAIGHAVLGGRPEDGGAPRTQVRPSTPFCLFSASKAVVATVIHLLDERGALRLDDEVADHLPEWDREDQAGITIEHLLTHQAGFSVTPAQLIDLDRLDDPEWISRTLRELHPSAAPGRHNAYHALTGGFILAEVVRRATGQEIGEVLEEEILGPLGFAGMRWGTTPEGVAGVARSYVTGPPQVFPISALARRALGLAPDDVTRISNDPRFLTGVIPSGNTISTANEVSRFFELLRRGGELDGVRVMRARTVRRAVAERTYHRLDRTLLLPIRYGAGFMLGARWVSLYGPNTEQAFGHLGYMNIVGWADPQRGVAAALMTSGKPIVHHALIEFWDVMRRIALEAPESAERPLRR